MASICLNSSRPHDDAKALELADSLTPLATLKEKVDTGYFEQAY